MGVEDLFEYGWVLILGKLGLRWGLVIGIKKGIRVKYNICLFVYVYLIIFRKVLGFRYSG